MVARLVVERELGGVALCNIGRGLLPMLMQSSPRRASPASKALLRRLCERAARDRCRVEHGNVARPALEVREGKLVKELREIVREHEGDESEGNACRRDDDDRLYELEEADFELGWEDRRTAAAAR